MSWLARYTISDSDLEAHHAIFIGLVAAFKGVGYGVATDEELGIYDPDGFFRVETEARAWGVTIPIYSLEPLSIGVYLESEPGEELAKGPAHEIAGPIIRNVLANIEGLIDISEYESVGAMLDVVRLNC